MKLQFPTQPPLLIGGEIYDAISALIGWGPQRSQFTKFNQTKQAETPVLGESIGIWLGGVKELGHQQVHCAALARECRGCEVHCIGGHIKVVFMSNGDIKKIHDNTVNDIIIVMEDSNTVNYTNEF